ncbi:phage terminase large subunit [Xanthobacter sp. V0B-10]|uniref:phage terminase large subunit n=1 Tax=Xanthobacter albus TaxID=3119929 RepID=UPI0037280B63
MASQPGFSTSDLDLLEQLAVHEARDRFWAYRQYLTPSIKIGWWQREVAGHLQQFKADLLAGAAPMLVIQAPPQHGKSFQVIEWVSWLVGHAPDLRCIYASFSERLGVRANLRLQRIFDGAKYKGLFPGTRINSSNVVTLSGQHLRNREILEFVDREGYFRNTTVRGPITGEGLDLGIIDDPIKGREEANSQTIRDKTWDWLMDDFFTRFSEHAGLLVILTRWHIDDPIGRLIEREPKVKVLRYPAIAEVDEPNRRAGEPLFPEHKSLDFLLQRKALMSAGNWEALYQQNPMLDGGNLFKSEWFLEHDEPPRLKWRAIYVDTAQKTKERNDFSVFQHWGQGIDGKAYLLGLTRGRFEAPELEATALRLWSEAAKLDRDRWGVLRKMAVEDKVSGTGLIQALKRKAIPVSPIQRDRDKYTRALDVVPSIAAGLVSIPKSAPWKRDFMSEVLAFPDGAHDDQVDPMMDAVSDMCGSPQLVIPDSALARSRGVRL